MLSLSPSPWCAELKLNLCFHFSIFQLMKDVSSDVAVSTFAQTSTIDQRNYFAAAQNKLITRQETLSIDGKREPFLCRRYLASIYQWKVSFSRNINCVFLIESDSMVHFIFILLPFWNCRNYMLVIINISQDVGNSLFFEFFCLIQDITFCQPWKWKAIACTLQIKPCHSKGQRANWICKYYEHWSFSLWSYFLNIT